MQEKVSVIIPTYNRAHVIARAVQSVLEQTYANFELLVVDDGSTDDTKQIIEYAEDDRIRYICLEKNGGASHARNVGIQMAECEYIAFLDSDDEWMPEKLERQMQIMRQAPETVGLVYCRMSGVNRKGEVSFCPDLDIAKERLEGNLFSVLMKENMIGTPTVLVRKKCLEQAGGFNESLTCIEDWELFLRIAQDWEIAFAEETLVSVHVSEVSVSQNIAGYVKTRCYMISRYWMMMEENQILEDVMAGLLQFAQQYGCYEEAKRLLWAALRG